MNEALKTSVSGSAMERTQTSEWFSWCKVGKT